MRNMRTSICVGALVLTGISAWAFPAAADTLAVDFTASPTSNNNNATIATAYGYDLLTTSVSLTVTGLGELLTTRFQTSALRAGRCPPASPRPATGSI